MIGSVLDSQVDVKTDWREAFEAWDGRRRSEKTVEAHRSDLNVFCRWFEAATGFAFEPQLLNSFDLARFRQWQLEVARVAPATWNRRLASLRVLGEWMARKAGMVVPDDLFEGIGQVEEVSPAPEWLTDGEFERLGRYLESTAFDPYDDRTAGRRIRALRDRTLAAVMLYAGLREMEAANLTIADINLSERKGRITVRMGKGEKTRGVPLADAGLRKMLKRWLETRGAEGGVVFPSDSGGRMNERTIQERVGVIGTRCGVEDLRAHRLRHTFGKRMADAGVAIQVIATLMGHSSLEITRRYIQPGEEDLAACVGLMRQGKMAKREA